MRRISWMAALLMAGGMALAEPVAQGPKNVPEFAPAWPNQTRAPAMQSGVALRVEVLAEGLSHPWGIALLPGGGYLITERDGGLLLWRDGELSNPVRGLPEVAAAGQGGLLDVAVAPDFAATGLIYLTYAKPVARGRTATAVAKGVLDLEGLSLGDVRDIFVQAPPSASPMHYGSRIVLEGDHAFVTLGEHSTRGERVYAQHLDKTYGKVVRIGLAGGPVAGNPFAGEGGEAALVWSLGHRNPQGAALRPGTGELWTLEHGPRGGDELNRIEVGRNYGWPVVSYGENYNGSPVGEGIPRAAGFTEPRYYWDPVIAPGGFVFYEGAMFADWAGDVLAASLNPGGLVRLRLEGDEVVGEERFLAGELRLRDVEIDRDGAILLLDDGEGRLLRVTRD